MSRGSCVVLLLLAGSLSAQENIVPAPETVRDLPGSFTLRSQVTIVVEAPDRRIDDVALLLAQSLAAGGIRSNAAYRLPRRGEIVLEAPPTAAADSESFDVVVTAEGVRLRGGSITGLIWAVQTFRQLLPPAFEGSRSRGLLIPAVEIHDRPRYRWRGAMLDAARHFLTIDETRRFIDQMSRYKLNVLHWHLTDDQGWRLAITSRPRLTEVGAWRTEPDGSRHGGFYSQQEIRDVVEYARRRGVTVVPEIEMPGHASAAIASYPALGCSDSVITVPNSWGVFPDVFCLGKAGLDTFINEVLDEVVALFPSRYIHLGGDEAPNIPDSAQVAFTRFLAAALEQRGRRLIGWDEITEGGLPPGAAVQVWRSMAFADTATSRRQEVIASPESHTYLNRSPAELPLDSVYAFNPSRAASPYLLGGEVTLWSEHIDGANLELMAFPRLLAFAEAMWSVSPRNYAAFKRRLDLDHYARLRAAGVTPGPEDRHIARLPIRVDSTTGAVRVMPDIGASGIAIRHTLDSTEPTAISATLDSTMTFDHGTVTVRAFNGARATLVRRQLNFAAHLARRRAVQLSQPPRPRYPGTGPRNLTDGLLGSDEFDDGLWQGWLVDVSVTIDLGQAQPVREVAGSFLQNTRSWILMPAAIAVELSDDGVAWQPAGRTARPPNPERLEPHRDRIVLSLAQPVTARYVRVAITTGGPLPSWHGGAGNPSWVFADEILVR